MELKLYTNSSYHMLHDARSRMSHIIAYKLKQMDNSDSQDANQHQTKTPTLFEDVLLAKYLLKII